MTPRGHDAVTQDDDEETLWALLLSDIERGWIVPVVGRDLLVVKTADRNGVVSETSYYGLIAQELALRLKLPADVVTPDSPNPLGAVAAEYLSRGADPNRLYRPVRLSVEAINARLTPDLPAALVKLAEIDEIRVFVTTTFDRLLSDCVTAARGAAPVMLEFAPGAITPLAEFKVRENRERTVAMLKESAETNIVHVFGRVSDTPTFVVTEEDAFEFLYQLQQIPPKGLLDLFSQMKLLFVGCRFPTWLVRFFLRTARRQRLLRTTSDRTDFVVDPDAAGDLALVEFLRKFQTQTEVFTRYGPTEFVDELHRRYMARQTERGNARSEWMTPWSIFISYAIEDAAEAHAIADELRQRDLPVWLDRARLGPGDDWSRKIQRNIKGAAAFVPILSRAAANAPSSREFRKEWRFAEDVVRGLARTDPFIFPIVVDDVSRGDARIDEELRATNWTERRPGGALPDIFFTSLRDARRRAQLAEQGR